MLQHLRPLSRSLILNPKSKSTFFQNSNIFLRQRQVSWVQTKTEEVQTGDYPDLPTQLYLHRPPLGWDDIQERRNIGEPISEEFDALSVWSFDAYKGDTFKCFRHLCYFGFAIGVTTYIIYVTLPEDKAVKKTYPYNGLLVELGGNPSKPEDKYLAVPLSLGKIATNSVL
nr:11411_t:CDS:2 [Entrophospora candida]